VKIPHCAATVKSENRSVVSATVDRAFEQRLQLVSNIYLIVASRFEVSIKGGFFVRAQLKTILRKAPALLFIIGGTALFIFVSLPASRQQSGRQTVHLPTISKHAPEERPVVNGSDTAEKTADKTAGGRAVLGSTSNPASPVSSANTQPAPNGNSTIKPATLTVTLSVQGKLMGDIALASGSNHCDVLTVAKQSGRLSSLDMRYNAQYQSYAVYVIDGLGDSRTVEWTYTVNGVTPPLGCSHVKAKDGDFVQWKLYNSLGD